MTENESGTIWKRFSSTRMMEEGTSCQF